MALASQLPVPGSIWLRPARHTAPKDPPRSVRPLGPPSPSRRHALCRRPPQRSGLGRHLGHASGASADTAQVSEAPGLAFMPGPQYVAGSWVDLAGGQVTALAAVPMDLEMAGDTFGSVTWKITGQLATQSYAPASGTNTPLPNPDAHSNLNGNSANVEGFYWDDATGGARAWRSTRRTLTRRVCVLEAAPPRLPWTSLAPQMRMRRPAPRRRGRRRFRTRSRRRRTTHS